MKIETAHKTDIKVIFELYDMATAYQKSVYEKQWEGFEQALIEKEIEENRLWKICSDDQIICVFSINFSDKIFWGDRDKQPAIYMHRIALHNNFRGQSIMSKIIEWAKTYCKANGKAFVRMDTWGENQKLLNYYKTCGFNHLETMDIDPTDGFPAHYKGKLALLEMVIKKYS